MASPVRIFSMDASGPTGRSAALSARERSEVSSSASSACSISATFRRKASSAISGRPPLLSAAATCFSLCSVRLVIDIQEALERSCPSRSEEHTSELQSLMRISYAVFCLKKKKHKYHNNIVYTICVNTQADLPTQYKPTHNYYSTDED